MTSRRSKDDRRLQSRLRETPIAVIGAACLFPQARNLKEFWNNIVKKTDSITDVPPDRWDVNDYYDPDPRAPDKTYCKRGGFLPEIDFDPMEFGIPPNILEVTDVSQLLSLIVAKGALEDAHYGEASDFDRDRIGIVLGVGGGQKLITPLTTRLQYPVWPRSLRRAGSPRRMRRSSPRRSARPTCPGKRILSPACWET
jgi:acyl transferase domain-containing protein